jgi:hypothetical protein
MFDSIDPRWSDSRERDAHDERDRQVYRDSRERGDDPRDALLNDLDLPRGLERELVLDRDHVYELNGEDSRTLGAVGAFRVVPERDLDPRDGGLDPRNDSLDHLVEEGLLRTISIDGHDRAVVLTDQGRDLLEANRRDRGDERQQEFYAGVNRPRELNHDAHLYRAYLEAERRLRDEGAEIQRVVLEHELKREYQSFLQKRKSDVGGFGFRGFCSEICSDRRAVSDRDGPFRAQSFKFFSSGPRLAPSSSRVASTQASSSQ